MLAVLFFACVFVTLFSHLYSSRTVTRHFGQYNRYYIEHLYIFIASFNNVTGFTKVTPNVIFLPPGATNFRPLGGTFTDIIMKASMSI